MSAETTCLVCGDTAGGVCMVDAPIPVPAHPTFARWQERPCPYCGGTGRIQDIPCTTCGGQEEEERCLS